MSPTIAEFDNDRLLPTTATATATAGAQADPANAASMTPAMALALASNFGSAARWRSDLLAHAQALRGEAGWVGLMFQPQDGRLVTRWSTDALAALPGATPLATPILALTAPQPQAASGAWADLLDRIDWALVYGRYQSAVHDAGADLGLAAPDIAGRMVLDVRRAGVFEAAPSTLPDARWCDPAGVDDWSQQLPRCQAVLVYCVYGHEVGRVTALRLRAAGLDARFLIGGIDSWQAAGRPLVAKAGGLGAA